MRSLASRLALACGLAALLAACGGGRAQSCSANKGCPSPQICAAGLCASPGCSGGFGTCAGDGNCSAGQHCASGCCAAGAPGHCTSDADCLTRAGTPVCDTAAQACVQCLNARDCTDPARPNCDVSHTCVPASGCTGDAQCASTPATPHCVTGTGNCAACNVDKDCLAGQTCSSTHTCVTPASSCTSDKECSAPRAHCTSTGATPGICVQCVSDAQCPGQICARDDTCQSKQCSGDADCAQVTGALRCNTAGSPAVCVACLGDGDCPSPDVCSTAAKTCVPPPTGADGEACNADGSCNSGLSCVVEPAGLICRTRCNPYAAGGCAAVGADRVCSWTAFDASGALQGICEPKSGRGAAGTSCDPNVGGCERDLFCAPTSATAGVCATLCNPASPSCASGACNAVVGAVGASGAPLTLGLCGAASKWGAACVTDTGSAGPDCGSALNLAGKGTGLFCTPSLLPAENPSRSILGICQFTPAVAMATGGAGADCTLGDNYCRTGLCLLDGSATCFAGCAATADCVRDGSSTARCLDVGFSVDDGRGDTARGVVASCLPPCLNDAACPAGGVGRSCQPQPTHNGSSWSAACGPVFGAGHGGAQCSHDSDCNSGACITAATLLQFGLGLSPPAGFVATDGYCLGACDECNGPDVVASTTCPSPGAVSDCDATSTCDGVAALPLNPGDGDLGIVGYADATSTSGVCFGTGCFSDVDCAGLSADASTPRVCAPYKVVRAASNDTTKSCAVDTDCSAIKSPYPTAVCNTAANNPNPRSVYGASAGIFGRNGHCRQVGFGLQCQPSLGAKLGAAGAACSTNASCQSGYCAAPASGGGVCYGPCLDDSGCTSTGTHCLSGSFLGLASDYCQ